MTDAMVTIILIRHGETDWNQKEIFRGRADVELNQMGVDQAEALARALRNERLRAIYASPLKRALKTAQIIRQFHSCPLREEPRFMDVDFGTWQGLPHEEVKKRFPSLYETWLHEPTNILFPEGESLRDVERRSMGALADIARNHGEETVAVVSHRVVNKVILCSAMGLGLERFWNIRQDTCACNSFQYRDGHYVLHGLNDTCHLREIRGANPRDF
jgi:broad specificity phosphatase PhoE